jgi:magnesium transporter
MDLRFVGRAGVTEEPFESLDKLLVREDGFVWLDFPTWTPEVGALLAQRFRFHPVALAMCAGTNAMSMVHGYADHTFFILHRPVVLAAGHVKLVELDVFVSDRFVVSIQQEGADSGVSLSPGFVAMSEVDETLERIRAGRVRPSTPTDLFHAIVSLIALRERLLVQDVALRGGRGRAAGARAQPDRSGGKSGRDVHGPLRAALRPHRRCTRRRGDGARPSAATGR